MKVRIALLRINIFYFVHLDPQAGTHLKAKMRLLMEKVMSNLVQYKYEKLCRRIYCSLISNYLCEILTLE